MKKLIIISLILSLSSCYFNVNMNDFDEASRNRKSNVFYWYYDNRMLNKIDTCYVVGSLRSNTTDDKYYINMKCPVSHDTLYIVKKEFAPNHNRFFGEIIIRENIYMVDIVLK